MNNIVSYAEDTLDCFETLELNAVDSLILSKTSYLHLPPALPKLSGWTGMRFGDLFRAEHFPALFRNVWDEENSRRLFTAMAASPRFRDMTVLGFADRFDVEDEKQFSAVTFQIGPGLCYVAFRGTDSTLVGWKEDFNMAFKYPVPSQEEAVRYLEEAAARCTGKILVGGHSKGGNLAVYSAAHCGAATQARIARVYSHDGPGFLEEALKSEGYLNIAPRIDKTVPQSSVIGMLLEQQERYQIVRSGRVGFWQHDPFSWEVEGNAFRPVEEFTRGSKYFNSALHNWVQQLSNEERERGVDACYSLLSATQITTLAELGEDWQKNVPTVVHAASQLDEDTRNFLLRVVKELATTYVKDFPELFKFETS